MTFPFEFTLSALKRQALVASAVAVLAVPAWAAPAAPAVRAEIDAVLTRLVASGCKFSRNGDWHEGGEARTHLLRKLSYLEDKGTVKSAEQFIELAATKSSVSGKAYQVQCASAAALPSATWLLAQLKAVRESAK